MTEASESPIVFLNLRIYASNLPRYGVLKSLPDTYARVTSVSGVSTASGLESSGSTDSRGMRQVEWGTTEIIRRSSHPQYTKTFPLKYEYGTDCYFHVQVFRKIDDSSEPKSLGNAVCEVGDILGTRNHTKVKRLPKGGCVFCRLEPVEAMHSNKTFRFQISASLLKINRSSFSSIVNNIFQNEPHTIIELAKKHSKANHNTWMTIYRSLPIMNSLEPTYDVGEIDFDSLCNGNADRPIRILIKLKQKGGHNVDIGFCETTPRMLLDSQRDDLSEEMRPTFAVQKSMMNTESIGKLRIDLAQLIENETNSAIVIPEARPAVTHRHSSSDPFSVDIGTIPSGTTFTFQEFMDGGCSLDCFVAIDFTSSNGDPRVPGTLHHQSPDAMNDYEETIISIGNALAVYSQAFTVWGFGAKFGDQVKHIFQCGEKPSVNGVQEIIAAYRKVLSNGLTMSGPTIFDQVLQAAASRARFHQKQAQAKPKYCVLLVVTDGIADQAEETKRKLAVYASVPLSVIFVGVGRSDFKQLEWICEKIHNVRNIATFTSFRRHQHDPTSLGKAALELLPSQLVEYMNSVGVTPTTA